jgi:formiminoglutamate deiminase
MALAGVTCVGEFHYLHHPPGGGRYADPNAMGEALIAAAADAGVRLTLLDACYLAGGLDGDGHLPLDDVQTRFSDGDVDAWAARLAALPERDGVRIGVAAHSVRAVPAGALPTVVSVAAGRPLHVHLSEQPAENDACRAHYGRTPTDLLAERGVLGPMTTAVHATHLTDDDIDRLGGSGTTVCMCPTTERDLADGVGPAARLRAAGSPVSLGSDSQAVVDLLEEARAMELDERLATGRRGSWSVPSLLAAATWAGHASLGHPDAGVLAPGAFADLVAVRLDSVRTAGGSAAEAADRVVFAATAADVTDVVASGRRVVEDGRHVLGDVGLLLSRAVSRVTG